MARQDHTGETYGRLTILGDAPNRGSHRYVYTQCACGSRGENSLTSLRSGTATSCGCYHREVRQVRMNVVGERYSYLEIIDDAPDRDHRRQVVVRCVCGTEKTILLSSLRVGDARSCGCKRIEAITTHGQSRGNPLYRTWTNMKSRCNDPNAKYFSEYGGRGIKVCPEWEESFEAFHEWALTSGYQPGLTLDRQRNAAGYHPDNCRWVNRTAQQRNRRSHKGSSSQYVGVSFVTKHQKWVASIKINRKSVNLGLFATELEAARVRDAYIRDNNLENFTMNGVL